MNRGVVCAVAVFALAAICGCSPDPPGYHTVCDRMDVYYQVYYFDGKTPTILPQWYCGKSHLEKNSGAS